MRGPPPRLMRLVGLLGARPGSERSGGGERSRGANWFLIVVGAANVALSAWALASGPTSATDAYTRLAAFSGGLMLASWGAEGLLLRRGDGSLSRWSSVLGALTLFPLVAFVGLLLHDWLGVAGAVGWSAFVVAVFCFDAPRRRRSRQASADRVGPEHDG